MKVVTLRRGLAACGSLGGHRACLGLYRGFGCRVLRKGASDMRQSYPVKKELQSTARHPSFDCHAEHKFVQAERLSETTV